jgi:GTP-binding protein
LKIYTAEFVRGIVDPSGIPDDLPEIPVAGRSNVGKSAFLNFLCQRKKLVLTSRNPGKTREVNYFLINNQFYLVDIPGFGYARVGHKGKIELLSRIENYFRCSKKIAGIIYLLDIRRSFSAVDNESLKWIGQFDYPLLTVATKADKLKKSQLARAGAAMMKEYGLPEPPIITSSLKKTGRAEVLKQLDILLNL